SWGRRRTPRCTETHAEPWDVLSSLLLFDGVYFAIELVEGLDHWVCALPIHPEPEQSLPFFINLAQGFQNSPWGRRDRGHLRPQDANRIVDRVNHRRRRAAHPRLARALGAERRFCGRRCNMADLDIRHFRRHWYQVIHHTGVQHLALIIVDAVLIER